MPKLALHRAGALWIGLERERFDAELQPSRLELIPEKRSPVVWQYRSDEGETGRLLNVLGWLEGGMVSVSTRGTLYRKRGERGPLALFLPEAPKPLDLGAKPPKTLSPDGRKKPLYPAAWPKQAVQRVIRHRFRTIVVLDADTLLNELRREHLAKDGAFRVTEELRDRPLHELHRRRMAKEIRTVEIAESVLKRVTAVEPKVKAYLTLTTDGLMNGAKAADERIAKGGPLSPIDGMPIALKDIFTTQGVRTTCGSKILEGFVPPYDATVVAKLKAAGLNLVGKTNMDEFAMGSSTENSAYGPTCNPWDLSRVPGGTSGGSGAAVAAGECIAAIGTDTGGSIRQPASFTSVVGLKPTYGRVSRYGMTAFASSLDQGGPMTRDVRDAAILLNLMAGHDSRDSTSAKQPVPDFTQALKGDLKGRRIGLVKEFQEQGQPDPEVSATFAANLKTLQDLGAQVIDVSLPSLSYAIAVYYILAPCEASSNLGRYDGVRYGLRVQDGGLLEQYLHTREQGFGPEVKRRIMLGTFALSSGYYDAYYVRAMKIRRMLKRDFELAFAKVDLIASPVSPIPPFKLGEKVADPLQMYLVDAYTLPANLAGVPGISVPGGFTKGGLPIGLQMMAPHFAEEGLLQAAHAFEQATKHHERLAPLA